MRTVRIEGWEIVVGDSRIHVVLALLVIFGIAWIIGRITATRNANRANKKWFTKYRSDLISLVEEKQQQYPWMAQQFADLLYMLDMDVARELEYKKHPAIKAAEQVSNIAKEKRSIQKTLKMLEYQVEFYESAFPWLEEFKEVDPKEAWDYAKGIEDKESEYERLRDWLSPEEYQKLPNVQKYQLALDRYQKRTKSKWEIGTDFERYIGYKLEMKGYKVKYQGALLGFEDMGRDLVAISDKRILVVQCKRWAREKTIHEKHIFQLYGSVVLLSCQDPKNNYEGVFVTTTVLSDIAKQCADYLGIRYYEMCEVNKYPMIKCNISKGGEKIYHLPFDQQYDRVEISTKKDGAQYVYTVEQAENLGFRRACKWNPSKERK